jgi:hypothetical protein
MTVRLMPVAVFFLLLAAPIAVGALADFLDRNGESR